MGSSIFHPQYLHIRFDLLIRYLTESCDMYFTYKSILNVSDIPYGGEEKNEEILDYSKGIKVRLLKYACTQNLIEDT